MDAKVNENLLEGQTEHALCLYYKDDSIKNDIIVKNTKFNTVIGKPILTL